MRRIKSFLWLVAAIALLVVAYAWAGYWLAPRLIKDQLPRAVAAATGQRLALGAVAVQPFRLSVEVAHIALTEPDGTPLLGAQRLFVDAELASLWRRGVVLRAIVLDEPAVNLVLRPDGSLNLVAALTPKGPRAPAGEKGGAPLLISIGDLQVNRGVIDATDRRRARALHERLAPINVHVQDFTTSAGGEGRFHVVGRGERGAALTLDGRVAVRPFVVDGALTLQGLTAQTAWRIAGEYDRIAPPAGVIDLKTLYRIASTEDGVRVNLDALSLDARGLALRAAGASDDWIRVAGLSASEASVDVGASRVRVPDLRVTGAAVQAWTGADGQLNLAALAPAPGPAVDAPTAGGARDQGWRIELPRLRVAGSSLAYEDRRTATPASVRLAPLELDVDGFATDAAAVKLALRAGFNESGRIDVAGDWRFDGRSGAFDVDLRSLPIAFVQPYLDRSTDLMLKGGDVSVKGKLALQLPAGAEARVDFDGGTTLTGLHSVDRALQEDFVRCGELALAGIGYRSSPASLRIRDVLARRAYFKLVVAPDLSTNLADVLSPPRLRKGGQPAAAAAPAGPQARARASPRMKVRIDRVRVVDGSANFADLSIRPNFATGIEQLAGSIRGLSSDPASRASVELDGQVDRYAPVVIRGEVNLLAASLYTRLSASFSNIEMPTFTPYSGRFMGYKIEKGKLNAKFDYLIDHRRLDARHNFVLDQFTLGDRVDSEDAVHLPVKLAVALLKDRNGVIDIDLPVSGSLDDPRFRVGPLVWKALRNLLVKIATAPFALLGSLFGAGEEVRFVDFAYGSALLDPAARERLANVGKALTDRPQLKLEVPLAVDGGRDRAALADQHFDALLGGAAVRALRASDPAGYQQALDAAWRTVTGEAQAPRPGRARGEGRDAWVLRGIDAGEAALRDRISVPDADLALLAKQRADAVRDALIASSGLDPARVFVVAGAPEPGTTNGVRLALKVE